MHEFLGCTWNFWTLDSVYYEFVMCMVIKRDAEGLIKKCQKSVIRDYHKGVENSLRKSRSEQYFDYCNKYY